MRLGVLVEEAEHEELVPARQEARERTLVLAIWVSHMPGQGALLKIEADVGQSAAVWGPEEGGNVVLGHALAIGAISLDRLQAEVARSFIRPVAAEREPSTAARPEKDGPIPDKGDPGWFALIGCLDGQHHL